MFLQRLFIITVLAIVLNQGASAQGFISARQKDTANYPYWIEMMQDPDADFYATQSAFNRYWENRPITKGCGWKPFKRWEYINESRVEADGKLQRPGYVLEQYNAYLSSHPDRSANGNWTQLGPVSVPTNGTGQPTGLGRLNCIGFHPSSSTTFYVGSPSGGIWKTTNGGTNWTNLSGSMPTLGVSAILIHPTTPNTIWIGTGDRDHGDAPGMGVYKSTDGGTTWSASNSGMGNKTVSMMLLHPTNSNIILAATSGGIYKSTDGGASWSLKSSSYYFKDIRFKPGDPTIVYATESGSFYRSTNTGDTWTEITSGVLAGTRMVIGVSAANSAYVYLIQTDGPFVGCMRSTNSGVSFTTRSTSPNIMDYSCDGSGTSSQAWYDLCIAVDPSNAETLYVGGINTWKSTNGGTSWAINEHWVGDCSVPAVHADIHALDFSPLNSRLYNSNDGGLYYTANGGTSYTDISSGLAIAQVYKIGQSATSESLVINGYQDNGTATNVGTAFTTVIGGDGMECIIDYTNSNYRYGALYYGDIRRYTGSGYYYTIAKNGVNGITESGGWITPYILHETNASVMFIGYKNVWRTTNVKATTPTWSMISSGETTDCRVLEQSPANVDILYVVRSGQLKRSDNANATTPTWTTCALPGGYTPTDLEAHPTNSNIVYATAGYYVYKSTNKGASWTSISGTLPSVYTNCLVYDETTNEGLYVGNQTGVYYKEASMSDWVAFNTGMPAVDVRELEIFESTNYSSRRIKAATYGRGLWTSDLIEISTTDPCMNSTAIGGCGSSYAQTYSGGGSGIWYTSTANPCGYTTPGVEQVYSFTAPLTGTYSIQVTAASGYVDYLWKASPCASTGWTCIDDINSTGQFGTLSWTAGTTYYLLLDDEDGTAGTHTFYFNCPVICVTCPTYDFSITASTAWQTSSSSHVTDGCKMYRISVTSGQPYIFKTGCGDGASADYDTYLELMNASCAQITYNDDNCSTLQSMIQWTATYTGYAYLKVRGYNGAGGNYTLAYINCGTLAQPGTISGPATVESGVTETYSITAVTGALSYSWSYSGGGTPSGTGITITLAPTSSGTLSVTAINNCGSSTPSTLAITVVQVPVNRTVQNVSINNNSSECYDATQTITVAGSGTMFTVQSGGAATFIAGQNILFLPGTMVYSGGYMLGSITTSGTYCGTKEIAVVSTTDEWEGDEPLPMQEGTDFRIYPNPTNGVFTLEFNSDAGPQNAVVQFINLTGRIIWTEELNEVQQYKFDLTGQSRGIYLVRIIRGGQVETEKVVKQ